MKYPAYNKHTHTHIDTSTTDKTQTGAAKLCTPKDRIIPCHTCLPSPHIIAGFPHSEWKAKLLTEIYIDTTPASRSHFHVLASGQRDAGAKGVQRWPKGS